MNGRRTYLDTNIFIHAFEGDETSPVARAILDALSGDEGAAPRYFTSEMTVAELLVGPFRAQDEERLLRYERLLLPSSWLAMGPVNREVLTGAALLRAKNSALKLPDAIHLSTAFHFRCTDFLTGDTRIRGSYSLEYNLGGRVWSSSELRIIRPDSATLAGLSPK